jgi:LAO/AO transport system kinase
MRYFCAMSASSLLQQIRSGDRRALAKAVTLVENGLEGSGELLAALDPETAAPLVGITGPPGAGKSTLISMLIGHLVAQDKKVAVIAVDPTSPFSYGSLLGDRLRMSEYFNHPNVFIRSLATRGSLGGLSAKAIEISDVIRSAGFDLVIIETVGVGQSEVEIAGLADTTVLVLVPESGDDVQALKSGIMEIGDIYVVNKSDRPGSNTFAKNLAQLLHPHPGSAWIPRLVKTTATSNEGAPELLEAIAAHGASEKNKRKKALLYAEKAWQLIREERMKELSKSMLLNEIEKEIDQGQFQLYRFVRSKLSS